MNIWLELFGYLGMGLVFLSMLMTKVEKLRIINVAGSVICMIYGVLTSTWPTAFLNFGLAIINIAQLIRLRKNQ